MRKIVKRVDNTEETIEGTPEEIREYERILERDRSPKQKREPEVIKGAPTNDRIKEFEEQIRKLKRGSEYPLDPWWRNNPYPLWVVSCSICHRVNCVCSPMFDFNRIYCNNVVPVGVKTFVTKGTSPHRIPTTLG